MVRWALKKSSDLEGVVNEILYIKIITFKYNNFEYFGTHCYLHQVVQCSTIVSTAYLIVSTSGEKLSIS